MTLSPTTAMISSLSVSPDGTDSTTFNSQNTQVYITVHGHFYQPPRENPYLDAIERQPSAAPFHDWNERILHECYRPNAFARIFDDSGELVDIVNNYEFMSFNIGPTLMAWLDRYDAETYAKILEADRRSCDRLAGHGNAIAQVYNHIIMPLANRRDKQTQVRWGLADFRHRFGREPEGMWLAETAIDRETVEVLIDEGLKFVILAPSQVERCRPLPSEATLDPAWLMVNGGQIDPTRPYRCYVDAARSRYLDIFFYDGPISRDMGFNDVLEGSKTFADRLALAIHGDPRPAQIISVATDGETFGHHKADKEKCLAYCFRSEFQQRGWIVSNYAHYLSLYPPTWECELKEVTAWSCAHGVDRWQDDCGCGAASDLHQRWRKPLRESLNWLRDCLIEVYQQYAPQWLTHPWQARDEYIAVILRRSPATIAQFLQTHQTHPLSPDEQTDVLHLLEMQRHSLLMFTSCGWFFEEISRPEGTQILRYAARAIELAGIVAGIDLEPEFIQRLAAAPSNELRYGNGAELYRQAVTTAKVRWGQIAAHYAIASLFQAHPEQHRIYCYEADQLDYQLQRLGTIALAIGQVRLTSEITRESRHLVFAAIHLGGLDFHCCVQPFSDRLAYSHLKTELFQSLEAASAAQVILQVHQHFQGETFALTDLFAEEEHRIVQQLSRETITQLDRLYAQVYRDNYSLLMAYRRSDRLIPPELEVAAEVALRNRCQEAVEMLGQGMLQRGSAIAELEAVAAEAARIGCTLQLPELGYAIEVFLWRSLRNVFTNTPTHLSPSEAPNNPQNTQNTQTNAPNDPQFDPPEFVRQLVRLVAASQALGLLLDLNRSQEALFFWLKTQRDRALPGYMMQLARLLNVDFEQVLRSVSIGI